MAMFPTKILLATDGSESSAPALRAAAEVSEKTDSEVNVIYVGKDVPAPAAYDEPSASDQESAQKAQEMLDEQIKQIEEAGGKVAESYTLGVSSEITIRATRRRPTGGARVAH